MNNVWTLAAVCAPILHSAPKMFVPITLASTGGLWLLKLGMAQVLPQREPLAWERVLRMLWAAGALTILARWSSAYWPIFPDKAVSVSLLLLAAWNYEKGSASAGRTSRTIAPFVVVMLSVVLVFGIRNWDINNLEYKNGSPIWEFLFSMSLLFMMENSWEKAWDVPVWTAASGIIVAGVLSSNETAVVKAPFYVYSQGVSILGILPRLESLAACAMTMGFYCAMLNIMEAGKVYEEKNRTWIMPVTAAALIILDWEVDLRLLAAGALFLWGLVPLGKELKIRIKK